MKTILKFAVSSMVLGTLAIGCKPAQLARPATLSDSAVASSEGAAVKAAERAQAAIAKRDFAEAVTQAERAVSLSPRNAHHRTVLGQAYLASGRFASAEQSFRDSLSLDAGQGRASVSLALAEIAQGRADSARATLEAGRDVIPSADFGLALALAGDHEAAVQILEAAARDDGATAKTRQNLALAYAMAGRWKESHATAALDVAPAELPGRMMRWAQIARPGEPMVQVAALLGVTPVADPGQPTALALAPVATPAPTEVAAVEEVQAPVEVAEAVAPVEVAEVVEAPVAVAEVAPVPVPEPSVVAQFAEAQVRAAGGVFAEAVAPAPAPQRSIMEVAPKPTMVAKRSVLKPASPIRTVSLLKAKGGFVVQLGAFSSAGRVEAAWNKAVDRSASLANYSPASTRFMLPGRPAAVHRLSVGGFETRADAVRVCAEVRRAGGDCFVRGIAGDAPVQWVSRKVKSMQLAAR